jgi:endonuclease G
MLSNRILSALSLAKRFANALPGIRGVDYGVRYESGLPTPKQGVRFHFDRKRPLHEIAGHHIVPIEFLGIKSDVLEASYAVHSAPARSESGANSVQANPTPRDRVDPIQPGISVGSIPRRSTGTLGLIVRDNVSGRPCVLSNWHVLAGTLDPQAGDAVGQPGPDHFGMGTPPTVAQLTRWSDLSHGIDAAIAAITADTRAIPAIFRLGIVPSGVKDPQVKMQLVKFSAVTELTHCVVDGVEGSYVMDYSAYGDKVRWMDGFRLIPDPKHRDPEISLDGDSGSVWIDPADHQAVALHFGGEEGLGPLADYALAHPLSRALKLLNSELLPSQGGAFPPG